MKKKKGNLTVRLSPLNINEKGIPSTIDDENRSVGVVATTEAPAKVWDWERYDIVDEVLLMGGMQVPKNKQVPLLDGHSRDGVRSIIGSFRGMQTENGELIGRAFFASDTASDIAFLKVKEGHLTDFSVGYAVIKSIWIPEDEEREINGKIYNGPLKVSLEWQLKELSAVPIGADPDAKARADINDKSNPERKEDQKMDEKTRALLVARGMKEDATEEEAWAFLDTLTVPEKKGETPVKPVKSVDQDALILDAAKAERARIVDITAACKRHGVDNLAPRLIESGADMVKANEEILKAMEKQEPVKPHSERFSITKDEKDKFRAAASDALIIRSGGFIEKPAAGAHDLTGYTLVELARHSLQIAGRDTKGRPMEMVGRALQSSDFPYLLANVANKSLFTGWDTAEETWQEWCGTGSVPDFKTNYLPRVSEGSALDEMPEGMPYKYGDRTEAQESFSIATYGKMFAITRKTIINDDLNAISTIPAMHGEAASRKIGDVAYAVLSGNAAMGDGVALFASGHSNLVASGSGASPGISTIAAGILAMGTQKDLQGLRRLNIRPVFFLAPKALEGASEVFFRTDKFADSDTVATDSSLAATRVNPYSGTYLKRVYESRIDDDVATKWYLAANKGRTVNVYFLDGIQKPYMETKEGWNVDGVEYKVRIDVGAKAVDWKGLYQNYGA